MSGRTTYVSKEKQNVVYSFTDIDVNAFRYGLF